MIEVDGIDPSVVPAGHRAVWDRPKKGELFLRPFCGQPDRAACDWECLNIVFRPIAPPPPEMVDWEWFDVDMHRMIFRHMDSPESRGSVVTFRTTDGVLFGKAVSTYANLRSDCLHSLDNGRTWHRCEKPKPA